MNNTAILVFLSLLLATVSAAQQPVLVVPAIHTSKVEHLSVTPGLPYLVTAAEDAVKIWETASGRLIRTVPGSAGEGFAAAALSADPQWLATAGNSYILDNAPTVAPKLKLWDALTGAPIRTLHSFALGEQVVDLRFSPDQRYLMTVVVRNGRELTTLLFDPETGAQRGAWPGIGSFASSGEEIVLRQDSAVVLADIATGTLQTVLAEPCLLAEAVGDTLHLLTKTGSLVRWSIASQSILSTYPGVLDEEQSYLLDTYADWGRAQFSADGQLLMVCLTEVPADADVWGETAYRFVGFSTADGEIKCSAKAETSKDERRGIYSPDLAYFLSAPVTAENVDNRSVVEAQLTENGQTVHTFGPKAFEKITWANKYSNLDVSVYSGGELIVVRGRSFGGWAAVFYTRLGQSVPMWENDLDRFLRANNHLKDDRWRMVCEDYLSYQLIDTRTSATVASLLFSENSLGGKDDGYPNYTWAVTSPSGLFDASPDMMNDLHYVVGMEIIELEQLKARFYEPGLLQKLLGLNADPIRSAANLSEVPLYPTMKAEISADGRQLRVQLTPRSGGIGKLSFFVNGKEELEDANPERTESVTIDLTKFGPAYLPRQAAFDADVYGSYRSANQLVLRAYNAEGWLKSAPLELDYDPPAAARGSGSGSISSPFAAKQPSLYAIVVGTADYAGDQLNLTFADLDAAYFSQALRAVAPKIYDEVEVVLLNTDAQSADRQGISDKRSIQKAFTDLHPVEGADITKVQAQDVLVIYFSGHGLNYGTAEHSQFYYLTKDIASENLSDPEIRNNYAISSAELTEWIKKIPARKQVMVIDACNSGKVVEDFAISSRDISSAQIRALDRMKDRTGMFILTGSAADKVSYEASQYGQGLLTYSLLEGMSVLGREGDGRVDVMRLFQHARDKVPELARSIKGIQTPMLAFPASGASFDLGIADASVRIPMVQIKPVFIRNVFQDEDSFDDVLGLGQALGDYFRSVTVKGAQAELIYWDVNEYENAYSLKGLYGVAGEVVTVRARLFKGKTVVGEAFTVTGNKADVLGLVEAIMEQVDIMLLEESK
jgi:hypothetical protein